MDTDGDLDIVEALAEGPPRVLRNNGDGTFAVLQPFGGDQLRCEASSGPISTATVCRTRRCSMSAGSTRVFLNLRGGGFRERPVPATFAKAVAVTAAEVTGDSLLDVLALTEAGVVVSLSQSADGSGWTSLEIARLTSPLPGLTAGAAGLLLADSTTTAPPTSSSLDHPRRRCCCAAPERIVRALDERVPMDVRAAADLDGDGRLELIGVQPAGRPATARSSGGRAVSLAGGPHARRDLDWRSADQLVRHRR